MINLITDMISGELYQYYPISKHVVHATGMYRGLPAFKHTHIEITDMLERLAAGESIEAIVAGGSQPCFKGGYFRDDEYWARRK